MKRKVFFFVDNEWARSSKQIYGKALVIHLPSCYLVIWNHSLIFLETHHALEGIAAHYATLRGTDEDLARIKISHLHIQDIQESGDVHAEVEAVLQYQLVVTEAAHNVVLLHILRCMVPMLEQNIRQNFECLYTRKEMHTAVSKHRTQIFEAIIAREPEKAQEASHRHLAFIEEILLGISRERSLRRVHQYQNLIS